MDRCHWMQLCLMPIMSITSLWQVVEGPRALVSSGQLGSVRQQKGTVLLNVQYFVITFKHKKK